MSGQVIISVATSRRRLDPRVRDSEYTVTVDTTSDIGAVVARLRGLEAAVVAWIERESVTRAVPPEPAAADETSAGSEADASSNPEPEADANEEGGGGEPELTGSEATTNVLRSADVIQDSGRE